MCVCVCVCVCVTRVYSSCLFHTKGDLLLLERPYAKAVSATGRQEGQDWSLEIGPATVLYVSPSPETDVCIV